ncbi:hypothetical protein HNQ07_002636 [Deinococcus metalli]|uniref:Uncharacterized protein n=1 Tax=Deinococcus metalli TaxID=1141878 RepID=A0A7W8NRR2_9DEIO|nr:hypothetical protein [Deinococcus metalli]MBB5377163.1 hypothetical protein [Deinococcus metalli]GHF48514.1 hypothetical protein GCM10017781_26120 [Deinococcus metalli]
MNTRILLVLTALSVSAAAAQTTSTDPAPPPTSSAPPATPLPGMTAMGAAWTAFLGTGSAELLGTDGAVIGTVDADGNVTLQDGATLADVKAVQVTAADGGAPVVYTFTRDVSKPGAIKVALTAPNGKTLSLPLPALAHRRDKDATADTPEQDEDAAAAPDSATSAGKGSGKDKGKGKGAAGGPH